MRPFLFLMTGILMAGCASPLKPIAQELRAPDDYFILKKNIRLMDIDHMGNIFIVDEADRLTRYDTTGREAYTVAYNNLGAIHSIDVGNPFKIMLFYRDQQTIILLDRTLSEIQRIPLVQWGLQDVTAAALSPDNALWVFSGEQKTLMKLSDKGDPLFTSDPFDVSRVGLARPDFIYDNRHYLLVQENKLPLAIFDDFGNYLYTVAGAVGDFSMIGEILLWPEDSEMKYFNIRSRSYEKSIFPYVKPRGRIYFHPGGNYLYAFDEKGVYKVSGE